VSRPHCVIPKGYVLSDPTARCEIARSLDEVSLFSRAKAQLVSPEQALRGRAHYDFAVPDKHFVNGRPITAPFPDGLKQAVFGLGCFWGAEEVFWQQPGVWTTAVGYAGGYTEHPSYEEVCSGRTGHTEAVLVVYDPAQISYAKLVATFFEVHDPTQGMRQGNDIGTQYRSAIYYADEEQKAVAEQATKVFAAKLDELGYGGITTEIAPLGEFYYAEGYHQQYLAKNPNGYRCHATTGVPFPLEQL
jgi:peptide-methionine (S)-S-oxide reductase